MIDRYELNVVFESKDKHNVNDPLVEYKGPLLAELLRLIINVVTYTPTILGNPKACFFFAVICISDSHCPIV
jgi:hypothetical protein